MSARSRAATALANHAVRLRRLVRAAHEATPDAVHDLRVTARRIETLLRLWDEEGEVGDLRRRVRAIRRGAGVAREDEVLRSLLRGRRLGGALVPAPLRDRWCRMLDRRLDTARRLPSRRATDAVARALLARAEVWRARGGGGRRAQRRVHRWESRARDRVLSALTSGSVVALHEARLAVKRWRYAAEAIGGGGARAVPEARRWQRALGDANDRASLVAFAARRGPAGRSVAARLERARLASLRSWRRRPIDPARSSASR